MSAHGSPAPQSAQDRSEARQTPLLRALEVIAGKGVPLATSGTGIYAFVLLIGDPQPQEFKVGASVIVTLAGLAASLWIYGRDNPPIRHDDAGKTPGK